LSASAAWKNVITSEILSASQALSVGDILLSFPVVLLMGEGKEKYGQTT
jgi:maltooligosyltrehalose synthase